LTIIASPIANTLNGVDRFSNFSETITFTANASENIFSSNCTKNFVDSNVIVTNGVSSITISGYHNTAFSIGEVFYEIKYVEKGSSDLLETPTVLTNNVRPPFSDIPDNKDVISVGQDQTEPKIRTYYANVTSNVGVTSFTFFQRINNDTTSANNFFGGYH
jgi:hypothetical protein